MMLFVAAVLVALSPTDKAAAIADAEARVFEQYARENAARFAERRERGVFGLGIGSGITPQGFAPLGDVGQTGFVYAPGSIDARRFKD